MPRKKNSEGLTVERILDAALRLIDERGLEEFNLRQLANVLGVNVKAIYYHVPSKDAIITGAIELAFSRLDLPNLLGRSWQDSIRQIVATYTEFAQQHPGLFYFLITYNESVPVAFTIDEALAEAISNAGFSSAHTTQIINMLLSNIAGAASSTERYERDCTPIPRNLRPDSHSGAQERKRPSVAMPCQQGAPPLHPQSHCCTVNDNPLRA